MDRQVIDEDEIRIMTAGNTRKLHIDSQVSTTHLLKKAVMVPTKHNTKFVETRQKSCDQPF